MEKPMVNKPIKTNRLIISLLLLLSVGCADLKAIRTFSEISAESATYTAFTDDYIKSVERRKKYQGSEHVEQLNKIIEEREIQKPTLLDLHKTVVSYMSALGKLASDELVSYDDSLNNISSAMGAINGRGGEKLFKEEEINAFGAIAKFLSSAVTDAYRQKQLKRIIEQSNDDFRIVISTMKRFIKEVYLDTLNRESKIVENYYLDIIDEAEDNPPQYAAIVLVKERIIEKKSEIKTRKDAAESYMAILDKIGEGHQLLYNSRNDISSKQLLETIKGYGKSISELYKAVKELNKIKGDTTSENQ